MNDMNLYGPGWINPVFETTSIDIACLLHARGHKVQKVRMDAGKVEFCFSNRGGQIDIIMQEFARNFFKLTEPQLAKARSELRDLAAEAFGFDPMDDIGF